MSIDQYLSASAALADPRNLPAVPGGQREQRYDTSGVRTIVLGRMLAQVALVPSRNGQITVSLADGDTAMFGALRGRVDGGRLLLDGDLPFKPGSGGGGFNSHGGNVFVGGGSFSSTTIINGRVVGGGGSTFIIDGREVDLERGMRLVIMVPQDVNLMVRDLVGAVGITDTLRGAVDFSPTFQASLVASQIGHLSGEINGSATATIAHVNGDADLEINGSGGYVIGSVAGQVRARIAGSGSVDVRGGSSTRLSASVAGSGSVRHGGAIDGDARLSVAGSGSIAVSTVIGDADKSVSGSGTIVVKGVVYRRKSGQGW
ncbi:GIN domain-containing protein [Glycomyces sp. YM15]|uniref:GIN domain-containing protein n=1 Tax=Glycomyces sp. YM15 TaxID=2800446 RepID=UPI001964EC61|nr:DUF2807 domain-containing protein [Glycomyces sp. YM15]